MKTIIRNVSFALTLLASVFVASATFATDGESTAFDQVVEQYESVRLALILDSTEGVAERGKEIVAILEGLAADWSPAAAGVRADRAEDVRGWLPELRQAAATLRSATSLEEARDAFYSLSKPLVRWSAAAEGETPVVAYCSMARRSWLQPEGELGNPYYGQSMLRCGEVIGG